MNGGDNNMFDNYRDTIKYITVADKKDIFGYSETEPVEKKVRYIGGETVEINENNAYRVENRLLYQCPFEVKEGDKFEINGKQLKVKKVLKINDIFGRTIYWEAQLY